MTVVRWGNMLFKCTYWKLVNHNGTQCLIRWYKPVYLIGLRKPVICIQNVVTMQLLDKAWYLVSGGGGHWDFRFWLFFRSVIRFLHQKTSVFQFWCSLRFADFPFLSIWFSVFAKNTNGFSDLISGAVFGFSYLTYLGSGFSTIYAVITRLHWSRIAAKRKCYRGECMTNQLRYRRDP